MVSFVVFVEIIINLSSQLCGCLLIIMIVTRTPVIYHVSIMYYQYSCPSHWLFVDVHTVIHNKWQSHWKLYPNYKLYKIHPNVSTHPSLPNTFSRREQIAINRLLIGHTHLTPSCLNKDPAATC